MTNYDKLINTLKEVFMLDKAELDFGIYRIMNQKRKDIEQFLEVDLVPQIREVLKSSQALDTDQIKRDIDREIEIAKKYGNTNPEDLPQVKELKAQYEKAGDLNSIENEVFSLLANFFKRYFDNGDFISMRRYKKDVYSIPYEGEEVKLHWANADQYYIKTSEYFKVYRFKLANGKTVAFELIEASTEQNNNKTQGDKIRRFAIYSNKISEVIGDEFKIYFTYEPADKKIKQSDLLEQAFDAVKTQIPQDFIDLLSLRPTEKGRQRTLLQKHLLDYTARNTFDYFIHKDLGGFLTRELDFYIKNEVLFIDDLNTRDEQEFLKQLSKIKAIKKIGEKIITFLAQLENFQKKLWLKKKMVVECNYCVTLDRLHKELYAEIQNNQAQIHEWIKLFAIDEIKAQEAGRLFPDNKVGFSNPLTLEFLNQNQFLVLDTAFFSDTFKWKLIGSIENFDEQCDGLLINSENFQALNLLQKRYKRQVKCTYIDPPYNTEKDRNEGKFIYKDNFDFSSWNAMIFDRINLSRGLIKENGLFFSSIDANEIAELKLLLETSFRKENFEGLISWRRRHNQPNDKTKMIGLVSEYILSYAKSSVDYKISGVGKVGLTGNFSNPDNDPRGDWASKAWKVGSDQSGSKYTITSPTGKIFEEEWMGDETNYFALVLDKRIIFPKDGDGLPRKKYFKFERIEEGQCATNWWHHEEFGHNQGANDLLTALFGVKNIFSNPKPIDLIEGVFNVSNVRDKDIILDYFSGSGTSGNAIISLNRSDSQKRKFILVEMGTYFDTVTKPRIQKVVYSKDWKDGKPVSREGISHCFKYMRLESYEDTLNNLALKQTVTQQKALEMNPTFKEGYMLNYMLDVEAKESLLNLEWFLNPFNCYLNITKNNELQPTKVDLVETFNYLIGLVVENYAVPKEGYIVVTGKNLSGESILIVWRDCNQHNSTALNQFLEKSKYNPLDSEYDRIYVNGDNNVENLKTGDERWKVVLIEEEFGKRMFEQN